MHGNVPDKALEVFVLGHEVGLAVYFHQNSDLASGMDIGTDRSFGGNTARFLGRGGKTFLPQIVDGLLLIAAGFRQVPSCSP